MPEDLKLSEPCVSHETDNAHIMCLLWKNGCNRRIFLSIEAKSFVVVIIKIMSNYSR